MPGDLYEIEMFFPQWREWRPLPGTAVKSAVEADRLLERWDRYCQRCSRPGKKVRIKYEIELRESTK